MSTTPTAQPPLAAAGNHIHHQRSTTTTTNLPSRPTTPLRSASRTSLRASQTTPSSHGAANANAGAKKASSLLAGLEPAFAELSDSMADLEANFMHLQLLNESMRRFNQDFAAFLYGLNMTAFCVDFPEAPIPQSFTRHATDTCQTERSPFHSADGDYQGLNRQHQQQQQHQHQQQQQRQQQQQQPSTGEGPPDATFLTTDTSFVEHPSTTVKPPPSKIGSVPVSASTSKRSIASGPSSRGGATSGPGRGGSRGAAASAGTRGSSASTRGAARGAAARGRANLRAGK